MNAKNRLIGKLLEAAKKHKILTYPVLALVALISVFSYFFSWSTGAGKRIVAVVMVLVMLVSQSYFLTSSATALVDTEETVQEQQELQAQSEEGLVDDSETSESVSEGGLVDSESNTEIVTEEPTSEVSDSTEGSEAEMPVNSENTSTEEVGDDTTNTEDATYVEDDESESQDDISEDVPVYTDEMEDPQKDAVAETATVKFVGRQIDGSGKNLIDVLDGSAVKDTNTGSYKIVGDRWEANANTALNNNTTLNKGQYIRYEGWYTSEDYTTRIDPNNLPTPDSSGLIWIYAKGYVENYRVSIVTASNGETVTYGVTGGSEETPSSGIFAVQATKTNDNYAGSFTIMNAERVGYKIAGIDADASSSGVSASLGADGSLTVSLSGNTYQQNVVLRWEAEQYNISYATEENGAGTITQTVTYNGTDNSDLIRSDIEVAEKEGHAFAGWQANGIQIPKEQLGAKHVSTIPGLQKYAYVDCWKNSATAVLSPYYEYVGVELMKDTVTYEYRSTHNEPEVITAKYINSTSGSKQFEYEVVRVTDGGSVVNPADYGLSIDDGNGDAVTVSITEGGLTGVVTLYADIKITDTLASGEQKESTDTLTIIVNPCNLTLDTSSVKTLTKIYDGNTDCDFSGEIATNVSGVSVVIDSSQFADANAGVQKVILTPASSWLKSDKAGDLVRNYNISFNENGKIEVDGLINQRRVYVRTYAAINGNEMTSSDYVRAGEANPEFLAEELAVDDPEAEGLLPADKSRLNELITLVTDNPRDDTGLTTDRDVTYRIIPAETKDANYKFGFDYQDVGTFKVRLESADDRYITNGQNEETGWYGENSTIVPKADSGYDSIRVEGSDVTSDQILLTEENTQGRKITFQLRDSSTGAYTAFKTISIDVDLTKPTYVSCEVIEDGTTPGSGLFFPAAGGQVSLGHYFNKSITFKVTYMDAASNPRKLVYSLSGSLTDAQDAAGQEIGYTSLSEGEAVFTFTIPVKDLMDKKGGIQFYAIDGANNRSELMNLVSEGDEWIVEKTAPETNVVIKSGGTSSTDGITITGKDLETYYGNVKAYLTASDSTSPITSITWLVNDEIYVENLEDEKMTVSATLPINANNFAANEGGWYTVSAYVTDKAGNMSLASTPISFKVDDEKPEVTIDDGYDTYQKEVTLTFNAYDTLSGVRYINVKDAKTGEMIQHVVKEVKQNEDGYTTSYCFVQTTEQGVYIIEVADKAGNVYVSENIVLDKVSDEVPECPTVTFSPEMNENGWVTAEEVNAYITNVQKTAEDKMPVDTMYQLWKDGETSMHVTTIDSDNAMEEITLSDGVYQLKVWSKSATGILCTLPEEEGHIYEIQVDSLEPTIEYALQKGADNSLVVNFTVKDATSGVNGEKIQVFNGSHPVTAQVTALEDGSGYTGIFNVTEVGTYSIAAEDIAGNYAKAPAFKPMSMKVNAVKNISATAATVGARVIRGTYNIKSASISYRKFDANAYTETDALPVLDEATGNMSVSAVISGLENGTNYVYKVTALSEGDEVLEYVGYFRTLADSDTGITISGTTRYADGREAAITVGLFAGNSCIRAVEVDTSVGNVFTFYNVPDGNYSVVATDGVYTKTARVLIREGRVIYPETNNLDLVLSGKNTSVVVTTDETPDVTAGNLDSLFYDEVNFTDEDEKLVEDGKGTVEYKLYATLMRVSDVTAEEISAMYSATSDKNKVVGAYLDLSLYKYVTDENGNVNRSQVTQLSGGANVSVTIPLGDLANKSGLEVVRIHKDGDTFTGAYLVDQDNNPATYTITTTQFSTYAVLYNPESDKEEIKDGTLDPSDNGAINKPTEDKGKEPGKDDSTTEKPKDNKDDKKEDSKKPGSSGGSSVGSLKSSGSAKTGDATPIAILFIIMSVSLGGFVVLRKKLND